MTQDEFQTVLLTLEAMVSNFYTATATNAKSRDENKALKKLILAEIEAAIAKANI